MGFEHKVSRTSSNVTMLFSLLARLGVCPWNVSSHAYGETYDYIDALIALHRSKLPEKKKALESMERLNHHWLIGP